MKVREVQLPDLEAFDARPILSGIDWLEFKAPFDATTKIVGPNSPGVPSFDGVRRTFAEHLEKQRLDVKQGKTVTYTLAETVYTLEKHGAKAYRWILSSKEWGNILITDSEEMIRQHCGVKGELAAYPLWHQGAAEAYRHLRAAISELFGVADGWPARVSRVDLAVDFQGFDFDAFQKAHVLDMVAVITRAHKMDPHEEMADRCVNPKCRALLFNGYALCARCGWERGRPAPSSEDGWPDPKWGEAEVPCKPYLQRAKRGRKRCTGWTWGKGNAVSANIYDKSERIRTSPETAWWMSKYEKCPNFDPSKPIARCELRLLREFLKDVVLQTLDGEVRIDTVEDVMNHAAALWRYCAGYPGRVCRTCGAEKLAQYSRDRYCHPCRDAILAELVQQHGIEGEPGAGARELRHQVDAELRRRWPGLAGVLRAHRTNEITDAIKAEARANARERRAERKRLIAQPTPLLEGAARTQARVEHRRALKRGINDVLREMFGGDSKERAKFLAKKLRPAQLIRPKGWIEIRTRTDGDNPSRFPVMPWWKKVMGVEFQFSGAPAEGARRVKVAATMEVARSQMRGNASSFCAAGQLYEKLSAKLGRTPTAEEVWRETCDATDMPEDFLPAVLLKIQRRGAAPPPPEPEETAEILANATRKPWREIAFNPDEKELEWNRKRERKQARIPRPPVGLEETYGRARTPQEQWKFRGRKLALARGEDQAHEGLTRSHGTRTVDGRQPGDPFLEPK